METKHILALILLVGLTSAGLLATLFSQRMRNAALFILLFGAVFVRKFMDVTFVGEHWYRGTIRGIEISSLDIAAWCILISTLLLPRYRGMRWYWPAGFGMLVLYFLYCCFNVAISDPQRYGLWELTRILRGVIVFLAAAIFIRTKRELSIVVIAIGCAVWFLGLNALEQKLWKGVVRPPATLDHENSFSMYLCTVSPVMLAAALSNWSIYMRVFAGATCALAGVAEIMTLSRAGVPIWFFVMGGTAFFCASWRITWQKLLLLSVSVFIGSVLIIAAWEPLKRRYSEMTWHEELFAEDAYETRGIYWRLTLAIAEDRPYGVGLNSWSYHVSKTYAARLNIKYDDYDVAGGDTVRMDGASPPNFAPPAHSLAAITWGELGLTGLIIFGLVWLRWFQIGASFIRGRLNPDPMHRMAIGFLFGAVGIFLQSVTEWTYRQTPIMFTFHVMMGALASLYYARRQRERAVNEATEEEQPQDLAIEASPVAVSVVRNPQGG